MNVKTWVDICGDTQGCLRDDDGAAIGGKSGPDGVLLLKTIAHRFNSFPKSLEALKRVSENAEGLLGRDGEYLVDDETYALIAELEEVS